MDGFPRGGFFINFKSFMALLEFTTKGIYCPAADVYIDPWKPVAKALITHGHADHSRWGHQEYLCSKAAKPVIKYRLGNIRIRSVDWGEKVTVNGVHFSFHPAGHIVGSAQIRVEYKGEVWVASGDYKLEDDGLALPFEPIRCHAFITESTFGLPVYKWQDQQHVYASINQWWRSNQTEEKVSVLSGYALGKAQRILKNLDATIGPIFTHGAVENINEVMRAQGIELPLTTRVVQGMNAKTFAGGIVIAPPSAIAATWMKRFRSNSVGIASGWMKLRGPRRRRGADRGFVLSDHCDWDGLNAAIAATGAERIFVTHGYTAIFSQWLREQGYDAHAVSTEYEGELSEINESA